MKVLFACAGTGGHLIPAVILARGLMRKEEDSDVLFCLSDDGRGTNILEREGLPWVTVPIKPFPRNIGSKTLLFPLSLVRGISRSLTVLKEYNPKVVVGTGGYVSGPVLLAAWLKGIPVIIQEQNNSLGLANRVLAPIVDEIHVSFPEAVNFPCVSRRKVFLTGNPVVSANNGEGGRKVTRRNEPGDPPVMLVMGGSQGAHSINRIMVQFLRSFDAIPYRIFFQTGERDYHWVRKSLRESEEKLVIKPFFDDLSAVYKEVDLIICRAGAMTLSEIAFWGVPSILIPYPYATGGHQERNAQHFMRNGAAIVLSERDTDWRVLKERVGKLMKSKETWLKMSQAAYALRRPDAKDILVDRILSLGK
jgi:UDP-N-acetylglucosamine--N-acetylmuramyl-(pentapeptide) pyrophosphoryl-undecaprenol N-acetylglucosamine transferase